MQLVFISGPPGAGKSAAAAALCERYDRMLHIDVDVLRGLLRMGRLRADERSREAEEQRRLFIASATDMARRFLEAGYGVVIEDLITAADLPLYLAGLKGRPEPMHLVVLLPSREADMQGDLRDEHQRLAASEDVAAVDPTGLTAEAVADRIMALAAQGRALVSRSG